MNKFTKYDFIEICKKDKTKLKSYLAKELCKYMDNVYSGDGYLYAKGTIPVMVTAHMDTVHKETVKKVVFKGKKSNVSVSSPQGIGGDDRCGVWIILELLRYGYKPYVLFCEDEEIGGIGSGKFCKTNYIDELKNELKYIIELDRANAKDAVFYDCGNEDFKEWVLNLTGYKEAYGSFSDIGNLSPAMDLASVNLSCGYYKAHTTDEYVMISEMENTLNVVKCLMDVDYTSVEQFDYQEVKYNNYYGNWYGSYYGTGSSRNYGLNQSKSSSVRYNYFRTYYYVVFDDENKKVVVEEYEAKNHYEALGKWCEQHMDLSYASVYDIMDEDDYYDSNYVDLYDERRVGNK